MEKTIYIIDGTTVELTQSPYNNAVKLIFNRTSEPAALLTYDNAKILAALLNCTINEAEYSEE